MPEKKHSLEEAEQEREVSRVEFQLESQLHRMEPDPEFIRNLHNRLTNPSDLILEPQTQISDLLIAFAVASGGILFLVSVLRLIFELLKATGVLRSSR